MELAKLIQSLLARFGIMIYRRQHMRFGISPALDIERLFGSVTTIVDVGANLGQTALYFAKAFPTARVYSFEPVPSTFNECKANTANEPRITCIPMGLGAHEHQATIRLTSHSVTNSLLNPASPEDAGNTATLSITTGDAWATKERISAIDLLKIDTEGYDLEVLKGAEGLLARGVVKMILVECEFSRVTPEPHTSFFELHTFLAARGMRLVTIYTDMATPGGFAWGNALFARVPKETLPTGR